MGIYLHEFIVCERVQVNPDNLGAMSALPLLLFKLNTLLKENCIQTTIYKVTKPWCNDNGVLNLHLGYYTSITTSRRLFRHNTVSCGTNHLIGIRTVYAGKLNNKL